jgi:hypothetical protein
MTKDRTDNEIMKESLIAFSHRLREAGLNCAKAAKNYNDPDAQRLLRDCQRAEELAATFK